MEPLGFTTHFLVSSLYVRVFDSEGKKIAIYVNGHYVLDQIANCPLSQITQTVERHLRFDQAGNARVQKLQCFYPFNALRYPKIFTVQCLLILN